MSNKYLQFIKEYIIVALACVVMAFNINYFFVGNKLAQGGVSGLSLIIHYLSHIDVSYLYFALNIPLIILAYIFLGKNFLLKTLFATFILSVFLKVFASFSEPLDDILNIVYEKNHIFYRGKETIIFSDFKGSSSIIGAALFPIVDNLM